MWQDLDGSIVDRRCLHFSIFLILLLEGKIYHRLLHILGLNKESFKIYGYLRN